jgi:hypothetical protein
MPPRDFDREELDALEKERSVVSGPSEPGPACVFDTSIFEEIARLSTSSGQQYTLGNIGDAREGMGKVRRLLDSIEQTLFY